MAYEAGQMIGTVVGSYLGGPFGAFIGSTLMGWAFPPPPVVVTGPKLDDLRVQSAAVGRPIAKVFGSVRLAGTVMAADSLREERVETEQSAKGGGPSQVNVTYNYYGTYAVALCEGPIVGIRRVWADGEVLFDASGEGSADETGTAAPWIMGQLQGDSFELGPYITVYTGTETQEPDPVLESFLGAGNVPAHRGMAYVVFDNLPLAKFGNRIPNLEFEVITSGQIVPDVQTYPALVDLAHGATAFTNPVSLETLGCNLYLLKKNGKWFEARVYRDRYELVEAASDYTSLIGASGQLSLAFHLPGLVSLGCYDTRNSLATMAVYNFEQHRFTGITNSIAATQPTNNTYITLNNGPARIICQRVLHSGGVMALTATGTDYETAKGHCCIWYPNTDWSVLFGGVDIPGVYPDAVAVDEYGMWVLTTNAYSRPPAPSARLMCFCDGATLTPMVYTPIGVGYNEAWSEDDQGSAGGLATHPRERVVYVLNNSGLYRRKPLQAAFERVSSLPFPPNLTGLTFSGDGSTFFTYDPAKNAIVQYTTATGELAGELALPAAQAPYSKWGANLGDFVFQPKGSFISGRAFAAKLPVLDANAVSLADIFKSVSAEVGVGEDKLDISLVEGDSSRVQGFAIFQRSTARQALEPLMSAYALDVVESGSQLRVQPRTGAPLAGAIPLDDQAFSGGEDGERFTQTKRANEFELPAVIEVQFANPTMAYQNEMVTSKRLNTVASGSRTLNLPLVMSKDYAKGVADMLLSTTWLGRMGYTATVSRKYAHLEPGDVVDLETEAGWRRVIIVKMRWSPTGLIQLECSAFDYSMLEGIGGDPVGTVVVPGVTVRSNPELWLMNLPLLKQSDDMSGLYAAAFPQTGETSGTTVLLRQAGDTYEEVGVLSPTATVGRVVGFTDSAVPLLDARIAGPECTLSVALLNGDLFNASSEELVWQGKQMFAYEVAYNQWAVGSYTSVEYFDGYATLSGLVLGLKGTNTDPELGEMTLGYLPPRVGGRFVRLNAAVSRVPLDLEYTGSLQTFKAVASGNTRESAKSVQFINSNEALKPLSPQLKSCVWANPTLSVQWVRRTRWPHAIRDGVDTPLGEASELYRVRIWNADRSAVLAERTTNTSSASFSASEIGSSGQRVLEIRQVSATAGDGKPYLGLIEL